MQADALALERREALRPQDVDAGHDRRRAAPARGACPTAPKSRPGPRASTRAGGRLGQDADAATVATRARSGVTSPLPSGCTRFERNITNIPVARIDPQRRAREAGMPERSDRQQLAAVRRVRRIDVPAEAAHVRVGAERPGSSSSRPPAARARGRRGRRRRRGASGRRSPDRRRC